MNCGAKRSIERSGVSRAYAAALNRPQVALRVVIEFGSGLRDEESFMLKTSGKQNAGRQSQGHPWVTSAARWAKPLFVILLIAVIMPPRFNHALYDKFLFPWSPLFSDHYPHKVDGVQSQEVFIPVKANGKEEKLHALLFIKPCAKQIVVVHHGQAGNVSHNLAFAHLMLMLGRSVLLYDYEGYGKSTGKATVDGICFDGETVNQWLVNQKGYRANQIINMGISLGTGVASAVASKHNCGGVILLSPYASLHALARKHMVWLNMYNDWLIDYPEMGSKTLLAQSHPPVLMMHGTADDTIPVEQADEIAQSAVPPLKYVRIPNAGHIGFFGDRSMKTVDELKTFMDSLPCS